MGTFRASARPGGVELTCKAASWSDAFETLAQAVFSQLYDTSTVGFDKEVSVEVEGKDLESLAAEWLAELNSLYRDEGFIPGDFIVVEVGHPPVRRYGDDMMRLRGTARGRMTGPWLQASGAVRSIEALQLSRRRSTYLVVAEIGLVEGAASS